MRGSVIVSHDALRAFLTDLIVGSGADPTEAAVVAEVTVWSDLVGRPTQGSWRLPVLLERLRRGVIASPCRPSFEQRTEALALLDGGDGFGYYLGQIAMNHAVAMARQSGLALVAVRRSNHLGALAYFGNLAAAGGMIGLVASNSFPRVAPYGGISQVLGTNPLCFAAPTADGRAVLVDTSTGPASGSAIRKRAEERAPLPEGVVAVDEGGRALADAGDASRASLLPAGPKGFALGLMIEILCGVLTGAAVSHEIASLYGDFSRPSNLGHLFVALDISRLMPREDYFARIGRLLETVKASRLQDGVDEVRFPGEARWRSMERQRRDGIRLDAATADRLSALARPLDIGVPWA